MKLKVLEANHTIDWFSFNQVYMPLLDEEAILLFMNLVSQVRINSYLKVNDYDYTKFIDNYRLTDKGLNKSLSQLEKVNLISISNFKEERVVKLEKVKSIKEFMKDKELHKSLKKVLNEGKYLELVYITGVSEMSDKQDVKLDKQVYVSFYNGVFSLLGEDFSLCNQTLDLIEKYKDRMDMEELHRLAYMSIIKSKGKYKISSSHLSFLIEQNLLEEVGEFNLDNHREFWSNLKISSEENINSLFNNLFCKHDPFVLYQLLTGQDKAPNSLGKWIRGYVQDKGCHYPVINALMSFVVSLLGKLPVNYLIKVSNTLASDYSVNKLGLMQLARNVIDADIKNGKNRLNAKVPSKEPEKVVNRPNKNNDFVWYFANK